MRDLASSVTGLRAALDGRRRSSAACPTVLPMGDLASSVTSSTVRARTPPGRVVGHGQPPLPPTTAVPTGTPPGPSAGDPAPPPRWRGVGRHPTAPHPRETTRRRAADLRERGWGGPVTTWCRVVFGGA